MKRNHNKPVNNRLEAWLLFLASDTLDDIIAIIRKYPEFKAMYDEVYEICRNMERVMGMFSKERKMLDENTVKYMIDDMQSQLDLAEEK